LTLCFLRNLTKTTRENDGGEDKHECNYPFKLELNEEAMKFYRDERRMQKALVTVQLFDLFKVLRKNKQHFLTEAKQKKVYQ